MTRKYVKSLAVAFIIVFSVSFPAIADVSVYAEGAYTDTDLMVYMYADCPTSEEPLVSYGVKLIYDDTEVNNPVVDKNQADWYFGSSSSPLDTPNAEPDTSTSGEVVIVGGKIDEASPLEGVSGNRVLLAVVTFDRIDTSSAPVISLSLGKGGDYANFVQVDGHVLDDDSSPSFQIGMTEIHERGDANGDGVISNVDMGTVRNYILSGNFSCYADANGDGVVSNVDMGTIRNMILGIE